MSRGPLEFPVEGLSDGVVRLRAMAEADIEAVIEACQDPEIPRWTRVPEPYGEAEGRSWFEQQATAGSDGTMLNLLAVDAVTDELLGSVGIVRADWEEGRCELGYWIARERRGLGIATRGVRMLCDWIFDRLPVDRIEIHSEPGNAASRRVAERAGFTLEGILRSYFVNKGARRDAASYSLLSGELR